MRGESRRIATGITMALMTGLPAMAFAQTTTPVAATETRPGPRIVLVELFTSEGCSSCPPADALLRQIEGTKTSAGQLIVGISEHVTYWNSLGWSDPFSSPVYTDRQNAYSERFHLGSVYTPQMVLDGAQQLVGSDRSALVHAIQKVQDKPAQVSLHILSANLAGSSLAVVFSASGDASNLGADVVAVLAEDADHSTVLRGENSGRTLLHVAVARSMSRVGKVQAVAEQTVQIQLPPSFQGLQGHHLILFAQTAGNGQVLGVDTRPL